MLYHWKFIPGLFDIQRFKQWQYATRQCTCKGATEKLVAHAKVMVNILVPAVELQTFNKKHVGLFIVQRQAYNTTCPWENTITACRTTTSTAASTVSWLVGNMWHSTRCEHQFQLQLWHSTCLTWEMLTPWSVAILQLLFFSFFEITI